MIVEIGRGGKRGDVPEIGVLGETNLKGGDGKDRLIVVDVLDGDVQRENVDALRRGDHFQGENAAFAVTAMRLAEFLAVDHSFDGDAARERVEDEERRVRTRVGEERELNWFRR